jgi:hypothetical protein
MMPNLSNAVRRFENTIQFQIVTKNIVNMDVAEASKAPVVLWFEGTLLAMSPRELMIKPEAERAWRWWNLFTDLNLMNDSVIKDQDGATFRVMTKNDWGNAGYYAYEIVEGVGIGQ